MVWRSLHIRRRISGPVGERTCIQGPAQSEAVIGFRRGAGRWIDTGLFQNGAARRGQVGRGPMSSGGAMSSPPTGGSFAWSPKPRTARRDQRSHNSPDYRLDQWSRLARSLPQGKEHPRNREPTGGPGFRLAHRSIARATLCIAGDIKISLYEWRSPWRTLRHWWER